MSIKHKVIQDFQLTTDDKKIIVLKSGTVLVDYTYITKNKENLTIDKEIIDNNVLFFKPINWKEELNTYLRQNKIPQPAVITKKLVPFIEEMFDFESKKKDIIVDNEVVKEVICNKAVIDQSLSIELETKIKKLQLKENQLDKEIEEANIKELEASNREKRAHELEIEYNEKNKELELKYKYLELKEIELNEK